MQRMSRKTLLALLFVLGLIGLVIANGMNATVMASNNNQKSLDSSLEKSKADAMINDLGPDSAKSKGKGKGKTAATKKKAKKPAESAASEDVAADDLDGATAKLKAAIEKAENERQTAKKVSDATKADIARYKDILVAIYKQRAEEARIASLPDSVLMYENIVKKVETVSLIAAKDSLDPADADALNKLTDAEDKQFNVVLKKTDKNALNAEQKAFLRDRTGAFFQETLQFFMKLVEQAQGLINQLRSTGTNPGALAAGCASAVKSAASGDASAMPELRAVQTLLSLFQMSITNCKDTLAIIGQLTQ